MSTEEVFLPQDPLLEEESGVEVKLNFKALNKALENSENETLTSVPDNPPERTKFTSAASSSTRVLKKESENDSNAIGPPKRIKLTPNASSSSASASQPFNTEAVHLAFAEFFFACNIPFKVLNSVHLKHFLSKLNKIYRPPSLRELTTTYLDRAYDKYKIPIPNEEQEGILLLSGWKDFTNSEKCIVACLYLTGENDARVFLNTWDLSIHVFSDNEDIQKKVVEESIALAKENHNAKIYAVISDNQHLNHSLQGMQLWHSVCQSYLAGCLAQDVVNAEDAKLVKQILQEFQREETEAQIVERGGTRVLLPWDNRWCTYRDSFQCYVKNNAILRDLILEEKCTVHGNIREAIFNDDFVAKIRIYVGMLEPLCKLIYLSQKKKTTLAEVTEEWMQLVFPPEFQTHLQHRRNAALTPFALAANFMHPVYRGRSIGDDRMETVEFFFLENLNSKGLDDMFLFKKNEGIFQVLAEKQVTTCNTYWSIAGRKHAELTTLAKKVLCIPASVSYIDKIFSSWSTTHLAARNLLGMEVYRKLTKTHFVLNLADNS